MRGRSAKKLTTCYKVFQKSKRLFLYYCKDVGLKHSTGQAGFLKKKQNQQKPMQWLLEAGFARNIFVKRLF
jgi:hypothetical protein